ncbi:MAG TPA: choice-of-anchor Q domain-containing protein, partial [Anaerolineae bacterium]|nr:choice-of-anchor Q domain-containing protein [Anaerolineae bacterium]
TGDITGVSPNLGPLQDNGGATLTHALLPCSPALDAGNPAAPGSGGAACASTDQRGTSRPQGSRCDIGAYEVAALYAKPDGAGTCTGSWANACSLQTALSTATYGNQIWVATGVYTPTTIADRTATFTLGSGVALYGGFVGTGSGCQDRDWQTNITVLSGDIDNNDLADPSGVVTTTATIMGTNSYHVVSSSAVTETASLDGFVITGGDADGNYPHDKGGGMYNYADGSPTLSNVAFSGNSAYQGGAMYNDHSSPAVANAIFQSNSAVGETQPGGGAMCNYYSNPSLVNIIFSGNSALGMTQALGGGLYNWHSSPELVNAAFSGNSAAGGCSENGGGIANLSDSSPALTNVTLSGNSAQHGGGLYNQSSSPTLTNAILWGNAALTGTQVYNDNSTPTISYSLVQDSGGSGGTWDSGLGTDGGGNIEHDPRFVDADGPDDTVGTPDDDLRLQAASPAIDAGRNEALPQDTLDLDADRNRAEKLPFDLDGRPRVRGGTVDMGAYEWPLSLTLTKTVVNDDGGAATSTDFQAYLDGQPVPWGVEQTIISGTYTVSESLLTGYEPLPWGSDCSPDGTITITLDMDEGATCSIVNDDIAPTITLTKTVINDQGGTATISDFVAYVFGDPYPDYDPRVAWGVPKPVTSGPHSAYEAGPKGYEASAWGGDCAPDGSITLHPGEEATCSIVNDDVGPTITLVKTVVNDDGGIAETTDFQAYIDGQPVPWGVPRTVLAGTHAVSESVMTGYHASPWSGDCAPHGSITVGLDEEATCSMVNDDIAPTLTLAKTVVNDDGGAATITDFQAYIDGQPVAWGVPQPIISGTHTLSEKVMAGYEASPWSSDCAPDGTITLGIDENATCSVVNDDIAPTLTLTKTVVNDDGGGATVTDFQAYLDGQPVPWGVPQPVNSGTHIVSETQRLGYGSSSWGGDCNAGGNVTVFLGHSVCTITNDDQVRYNFCFMLKNYQR